MLKAVWNLFGFRNVIGGKASKIVELRKRSISKETVN